MNTRTSTLLAVVGCIAAYGMVIGLANPLLSLILEARGVERTWIGLTAAMPAVGTLLVAPFVPRLMAEFGMHRLLLFCVALECVLFLLLPVLDSVTAWMLIRLAMGVTAGGLFIASETWINEIAYEEARGRIIGAYAALLAATTAAGPLVIFFTGIEGWVPFLVGAGFMVLGALALIWATETVDPEPHADGGFGIMGFIRAAPLVAASICVFALVEYTCFALLPVYGVRSGLEQSTAVLMLVAFGVGRIVWQWPLGVLADRTDRRRLLLICVGCSGVCALLLPLAVNVLVFFALLLFVWGGFANGINTLTITIIGQRFRGAALATANAGIGVLWGLAALAGPGLTGVAMDLYDPHGFVMVMALGSLLVIVASRFTPD